MNSKKDNQSRMYNNVCNEKKHYFNMCGSCIGPTESSTGPCRKSGIAKALFAYSGTGLPVEINTVGNGVTGTIPSYNTGLDVVILENTTNTPTTRTSISVCRITHILAPRDIDISTVCATNPSECKCNKAVATALESFGTEAFDLLLQTITYNNVTVSKICGDVAWLLNESEDGYYIVTLSSIFGIQTPPTTT